MKTLQKLVVLLLVMGSMFAFACQKEEDPPPPEEVGNWEIIVYKITDCGLCTNFEEDLDAAKIPYTAYDINTNNVKRAEMMVKLGEAGIQSEDIQWPVVDVMVDSVSHMFVQPNLEKDVKPLIGM
jgi:hypothetical protein